jgi:hypothetical protein
MKSWRHALCTIWSSHSGSYEEFCLLEYNALWSVGSQPTFLRNTSPPFQGRRISQDGNKHKGVSKQTFFFLAWFILRSWRWRLHVPSKRLLTLNRIQHSISQTIWNLMCCIHKPYPETYEPSLHPQTLSHSTFISTLFRFIYLIAVFKLRSSCNVEYDNNIRMMERKRCGRERLWPPIFAWRHRRMSRNTLGWVDAAWTARQAHGSLVSLSGDQRQVSALSIAFKLKEKCCKGPTECRLIRVQQCNLNS